MHTSGPHTPYAPAHPPQSRTPPPPQPHKITNVSGRNFILLFYWGYLYCGLTLASLLTSSQQVRAVLIQTTEGLRGALPQGPHTYETHTLKHKIPYIGIEVYTGGTPVRRLVIPAGDARILDALSVDDPLSSANFTGRWNGESWATYAAHPSTRYVAIKPGSKCPVLAAVKLVTDRRTMHNAAVDTDGECTDSDDEFEKRLAEITVPSGATKKATRIVMTCVRAPGARPLATYFLDDERPLPRTIMVGDTIYATCGMSLPNREVFVRPLGDIDV